MASLLTLERMDIGSLGLRTRAPKQDFYTDKGFISTTKDRNIAEGWNGFTGSRMDIILKVKASAHTKGLDISRHFMRQGEVVLKRGQTMKFRKVYEHNGVIYVDTTI